MKTVTAETRWKICCNSLVIHHSTLFSLYNFTGDTRRSQSVTFFNLKGKQGEEENQHSAKRKREELTPIILVERTLTSTLLVVNDVIQMLFFGFASSMDKQKEKIELKLNHLKDKSIRYDPHKDFLDCCIAKKLVPRVED